MEEEEEAKGGGDVDDVFVAAQRRTAKDRAWGVIFGIGARAFFSLESFFFSRAFVQFVPAGDGMKRMHFLSLSLSLSLSLTVCSQKPLFVKNSAPLDALNRGNQLHRVRRRAEERRPDAIGDGVWPSVFGPFIPSKVGSE